MSAQEASLYAKANDPIDFGNKIAELMDDSAARVRMGKEGRERVLGALSWAHSVPHLLAAYERLFVKRG